MEGTPEAQRGGVPAGVGTEVPWETAGLQLCWSIGSQAAEDSG